MTPFVHVHVTGKCIKNLSYLFRGRSTYRFKLKQGARH